MAEHNLPVFDADGHVFEDDDQLIHYFEGSNAITKRNRALPIFPTIDGWARGVIHEREDNSPTRASHTDSVMWGAMLDTLGAEGSVLYPTAGLAFGLMRDVAFATATATAYNNWIEDRYTARDRRLYAAGLMAMENPEGAAAELKRCATERLNFVAMMLPSATASPRKYGDRTYWPIYEAAVRHDMPLALHGGPSAGIGLDNFSEFAKVHTMSHPYPLFLQLTDMIWEGVFDEFPDLRVAYLEAGCSWVPFMMDRLDYEYDSIFGVAARNRLRRRPSDYFRETDNIWMTAELGERGMKYTVDAIGSARIMYASDFPHEPTAEELEGAVPAFLVNPDFDDVAKANILNRNAKHFYRIAANGKSGRRTLAEREQAVTIAALKRRVAELERELNTARGNGNGSRDVLDSNSGNSPRSATEPMPRSPASPSPAPPPIEPIDFAARPEPTQPGGREIPVTPGEAVAGESESPERPTLMETLGSPMPSEAPTGAAAAAAPHRDEPEKQELPVPPLRDAPTGPPASPLPAVSSQMSPYAVECRPGVFYSWCACGRSATQPFCDGSHKGTGHRPMPFSVDRPRMVNLCGCRKSGAKPFCDGSHRDGRSEG